MARPGKRWRHVIINTLASWLHGDSRGFRNRRHRVHSSGDYRHRPPAGEHAKLLRYQEDHSRQKVSIEKRLRAVIGRSLVAQLLEDDHDVLCAAVTGTHAHFLVELSDNIVRIRAIVGKAKRISSRAVKADLPGSVWSSGGTFKAIKDRRHQFVAFEYILFDQGSDAWTWSVRDKSFEGRFGRKRPSKKPKAPHAGAERRRKT
jgi:hypothetical protein